MPTAAYQPIRVAQRGALCPAPGSHDGNSNTSPVVSEALRLNSAARCMFSQKGFSIFYLNCVSKRYSQWYKLVMT